MKTDSQISKKLRNLLAKHALIVGPITLSNGSVSDHYFDCKRVTLLSEGADLVGKLVLEKILALPVRPVAIGGLNTGADPIIGSVMMEARLRGIELDGFYVRKEPKKHGTRNRMENAPQKRGAQVVIVDDVVTKGGSVLQAIEVAQKEGCNVVAVVTLVDRLEGGGDQVRSRIPTYIPLYDLEDFRSELDDYRRRTEPQPALSSH